MLSNSFAQEQDIPTFKEYFTNNSQSIKIDNNSVSLINKNLDILQEKYKTKMAVLIVENTNPYTIAQFSIKLAEKWKVGDIKKDNGIILVVSASDKKIRFEVGYGLEGKVTDLQSKQIIDDYISPQFKEGKYAEGIMLSIEKVANLSSEPTLALTYSNPDFKNTTTSNNSKKTSSISYTPDEFSIEGLILVLIVAGIAFLISNGAGWPLLIGIISSIFVRFAFLNKTNAFVTGLLNTSIAGVTHYFFISTTSTGTLILSLIVAFIFGAVGIEFILIMFFAILSGARGGISGGSGGGSISSGGRFGGGGSSGGW